MALQGCWCLHPSDSLRLHHRPTLHVPRARPSVATSLGPQTPEWAPACLGRGGGATDSVERTAVPRGTFRPSLSSVGQVASRWCPGSPRRSMQTLPLRALPAFSSPPWLAQLPWVMCSRTRTSPPSFCLWSILWRPWGDPDCPQDCSPSTSLPHGTPRISLPTLEGRLQRVVTCWPLLRSLESGGPGTALPEVPGGVGL